MRAYEKVDPLISGGFFISIKYMQAADEDEKNPPSLSPRLSFSP
jgi:hypothetical protein